MTNKCKLCKYDSLMQDAERLYGLKKYSRARYFMRAAEIAFNGLRRYTYRPTSKALHICENHVDRWKQISENLKILNERELARRIDARNRAEHDLNKAKIEYINAQIKYGRSDKQVERLQWTTANLQTRFAQRSRRVNEYLELMNKYKNRIKEIE